MKPETTKDTLMVYCVELSCRHLNEYGVIRQNFTVRGETYQEARRKAKYEMERDNA